MRQQIDQDWVVGLLFVLVGAAFAVAAPLTLQVGTAAQMGPGFLPFYMGLGLLGCGLVLLWQVGRGIYVASGLPEIAWGVLFKLVCLFVVYGLALSQLGLLPSMAVLLVGCRLFYPSLRWWQLSVLLVLTLAALWGLVSWVLRLNLPLWPGQY